MYNDASVSVGVGGCSGNGCNCVTCSLDTGVGTAGICSSVSGDPNAGFAREVCSRGSCGLNEGVD